jgi:hypothetical protein
MSARKDKKLRKEVRKTVGDNSRTLLLAMLDNPLLTRLRWCAIILFRLGYKDLLNPEPEA